MIKIMGEVQGVFFRSSACTKAQELNLLGYVKNEKDGQVTIEIQGEDNHIEQFITWCAKGPRDARVVNIQIKPQKDLASFEDFTIT